MNDVTTLLKGCVGKTLKTVREDVKLGTLTFEFEDSSLNTKITVSTKGTSFISSNTAAVKRTKPSLKAKEAALEPVASKKTKKKKPETDKAGKLTL